MTSGFLTLLILAAQPPAPMDDRYAEAVEVFRCDFGRQYDADFDDWPDHWTRRTGRGFPIYLKIGIRRDAGQPDAPGAGWLRLDLDGGEASVASPPIDVSPVFSYVMEGKLKTENLKHDVAFFEMTLCDSNGKSLETYCSQHYRDVKDWTKVRIGPIAPVRQEVRSAVIHLHVRPTENADLAGAVMFDDISLRRLPRITLSANGEHNVCYDPNSVEITCEMSGIADPNPWIQFEAIDVEGRRAASLERRVREEGSGLAAAGLKSAQLLPAGAAEEGFAGSVVWKPELKEYGFYRVQVSLRGRSGAMPPRSLHIAVMRRHRSPPGGRFGWSLPGGEDPLPAKTLVGLLGQVGISWVKFPAWYSEKDDACADRLAWLAERLSNYGVEMVGVLDRPPQDARKLFGDKHPLSAALVFLEPQLWQPAVDPVMIRLSLKVRWWQLGGDDDVSFVDFPDTEKRIREIRGHLEQFGQKIHLGVGWRWMNETPNPSSPPWDYLSYTTDPPLTSEELETYLTAEKAQAGRRWITLQPLPRGAYSTETRARDLAMRMLAAAIHGADGVFVPQPFHPESGLMTSDGAPSELLLPWRTTALAISGAKYIGDTCLPGGSRNHLFVRSDEAVMAVWSDQPATETIYLGEDVRQVDLWGRVKTPRSVTRQGRTEQEIEVGPLPSFITGLHPAIAQWRMSFAFDKEQLSSTFGKYQKASYRFQNFFDQGVSGKVELISPEVWETQHGIRRFKLAAGEEGKQVFEVLLRPDANSGPQPVRIDFDIAADRQYQFSVYRTMQIGLGDIMIEASTQLGENGELMVEQHLINETDQAPSFNCLLFAPDRRRQRIQVFNAGRGRTTSHFVLPDGAGLVGKTIWLRAEEIGGARILNHRVTVTP